MAASVGAGVRALGAVPRPSTTSARCAIVGDSPGGSSTSIRDPARSQGEETTVASQESAPLSAEELEAKYEEERIKRMTEGVRTYRSLRDLDVDFDADPYTPRIQRDVLTEETDVVIIGTGWAGMSDGGVPRQGGRHQLPDARQGRRLRRHLVLEPLPGLHVRRRGVHLPPAARGGRLHADQEVRPRPGDLRVRPEARAPLRHVPPRPVPHRGHGRWSGTTTPSAGWSPPTAATSCRPASW